MADDVLNGAFQDGYRTAIVDILRERPNDAGLRRMMITGYTGPLEQWREGILLEAVRQPDV